jgi:hypothetical protein
MASPYAGVIVTRLTSSRNPAAHTHRPLVTIMKPLVLIGLLSLALAARAPLEQAEDRLGEAVDRLADEVPPEAREDLEALREQLSSQEP